MDSIFSDRITDVPRSFIREMLKVTLDPSVISFAGGLPNRKFFPVEELLRGELTEEEWQDAFEKPPKPKVLSLVELIEQAQKKMKVKS